MQKKDFNATLIDSVYRKDKDHYSKVFLEKYNFNDSCIIDSGSDDKCEKIPMKKIKMKRISLKKIEMKKTYDFIFTKNKRPDQQSCRNAREKLIRN